MISQLFPANMFNKLSIDDIKTEINPMSSGS